MPSVRLLRPKRLAGILLLAAAAALVAAPPAAAHDELVATSPTKGATVTAAPAEVTLTFSEEVESLGAAVVVTDSAGTRVADGDPRVSGTTVTQALLPDVAPGQVKVAYRIVSGDGHPVSGSYAFTLDTAAPTPEPSGAATSAAATSSAATPSDATPSASAVAAVSDEGGLSPAVVIGGFVLIVAAGAAVAVGLRRGGGSTP